MSVFEARSVSVTYAGARQPALRDIELSIEAGTFTAVIGPNGSGKSTLLRVLMGAIKPETGVVLFEEKPLEKYRRVDLARRVAAVTQIEEMPFPVTVRELVATGRYAHLGAWRAEGEADRLAVANALERCDIAELADRSIANVSGGERQRARIARALAQEPATLVLDEPTAALDIAHEIAVFELLRQLTDSGVTVVIATHHINHASRFADQLVLLEEGRVAAAGQPSEVLRKNVIERVYGWSLDVFPHPGNGFDKGAPQVVVLSKLPINESSR
jgi:iron complex transport system ATP-binding protein